MKKLTFLLVALLLLSVVGCGTATNPVAPDTSDQVQADDTAQKVTPHDPPGDPDDGNDGPQTPGDPDIVDGGPH